MMKIIFKVGYLLTKSLLFYSYFVIINIYIFKIVAIKLYYNLPFYY